MGGRWKYLFGPVPSRRLGASLGVDIIPLKTCNQNCVYCQLGLHGQTTMERRVYAPVDEVLEELRTWLAEGGTADYLTIRSRIVAMSFCEPRSCATSLSS